MSENDSNDETTTATPKPAWRLLRWGALTDEQKHEWIATARKGDLGRFTADELWLYRDLADQKSDIKHELDCTNREIERLEQERDELDAMVIEATTELTQYQDKIEAAASERDPAPDAGERCGVCLVSHACGCECEAAQP